MDITFDAGSRRFNYRVCGLFLNEGKLLAMRDERSPYYYLPGGRVRLGETAEAAVLRETREELGVDAKIDRPLWLVQSFFNEDVERVNYHEICLYFLMDPDGTDLLTRGQRFTRMEGDKRHEFEWLDFARLEGEYLYPLFIKRAVFRLPETLELRTEYE